MSIKDVVALGEVLIDFTYVGDSAEGNKLYQENTGGAPANCVSCVSKLGGKGAFIGCTGRDSFGEDIRGALSDINVDISQMQYTQAQHTTLAFVTLSKTGERSFSFCRNPGADTQLDYSLIDKSYLTDTKVLHVGSLPLTHPVSYETTMQAVKTARNAGVTVSYDPNWRESLWSGREDAFDKIKSLFNYTDIVKISDDEVNLFFGKMDDYSQSADIIHSYGVRLVFITLGKDGAFYSYKDKNKCFTGRVGCLDGKVVDTTGAGDSFFGGILYCLTRNDNIFSFDRKTLCDYVKFGNAVATLCVSKKGAIPALPYLSEVEKLLQQ